jgi:hypothetical protein
MFQRQEKEDVVDSEGKTWAVKFDDTGKEIGKRLVNAIGTKDKLDQYDKQKGIDYKWDSRLLRDKANLTNSMSGNGTTTGPNFAGFDPLLNYQGQNGEILYKSKKGRGVYALQPNGSLIFYNGQPQPTKGAVKDAMEMLGYKEKIESYIGGDLNKQMQIMLSTEAGRTAYTDLTGNDLPTDMTTLKEKDYDTFGNILENAATKTSWDDIKKKIGSNIHGKTGAKDTWDILSKVRSLPEKRKQANDIIFGTQDAPQKIGGKLSVEDYNNANEMVLEVFSPESTLSITERAAIKTWIMNKVDPYVAGGVMTQQNSQGTYDDFKRLSEADQLLLLQIINEKTIK